MDQLYAGVDLGGTKIAAVFADSRGQVLGSLTRDTEGSGGPRHVLRRIADAIAELEKHTGRTPVAIGMGAPGLLDPQSGMIHFCPNLATQWRGVPAAEILLELTGKPAYLLNDARAATLGEFTYGAGRGSANMLLVTVGTGIGGGVVIDGKLALGRYGAAGEIGHQTLQPDGPYCTCGNRGCLERLVSGPALSAEGAWLVENGLAPQLSELVSGNARAVTPRQMVAAAQAGDDKVRVVIERAAGLLGIGIANALTVVGVDLVVIAGGMAALGETLLGPIRSAVTSRVHMFPGSEVRVVCAALGDYAGALGGIALAASRTAEKQPENQKDCQ